MVGFIYGWTKSGLNRLWLSNTEAHPDQWGCLCRPTVNLDRPRKVHTGCSTVLTANSWPSPWHDGDLAILLESLQRRGTHIYCCCYWCLFYFLFLFSIWSLYLSLAMFVWLCTFILHLSLAMFLWLCTFNFVKAVGPDISDVKDNVLSFYRVNKITVGVKLWGGERYDLCGKDMVESCLRSKIW